MKIFYKIFILFFFCMLFGAGKGFAGIEPYENFLKGAIKKGDSLIVKDEKFKNTSFNWNDITNISVKNTISLKVTDEQPIGRDFSCSLLLRI